MFPDTGPRSSLAPTTCRPGRQAPLTAATGVLPPCGHRGSWDGAGGLSPPAPAPSGLSLCLSRPLGSPAPPARERGPSAQPCDGVLGPVGCERRAAQLRKDTGGPRHPQKVLGAGRESLVQPLSHRRARPLLSAAWPSGPPHSPPGALCRGAELGTEYSTRPARHSTQPSPGALGAETLEPSAVGDRQMARCKPGTPLSPSGTGGRVGT